VSKNNTGSLPLRGILPVKTYRFKTHCKGDIRSSRTANIILPGLVTKYR